MPKPRGFSSEFGMSFDRGPYRYALVPWTWLTLPFAHWTVPNSHGLVDLRSQSAQAAAGGTPQGFAFVASTTTIAGTLIGQAPHLSDATTTSAMQNAWEAEMGYRPQGAKLVNLVWDQLTNGADPTGQAGPKPLMPGTDGLLKLHLGGHSLVKSERFRFGVHPHTNRVQVVLQRDFERLWEATNGADHCRRVLDFTCKKYRVDDWREFVPQRLRPHVPGRLPHATTITDNFNRSDADALGSSSEGWSWTETKGDIDIVSNEAKGGAAGSNRARAESALSGDDHYGQVTIVASGDGSGPCVRYAAAADTCYVFFYDFASTRLFKVEAGTMSNLGSVTNFGGGVAKLEVDGSDLEAFDDGVSLGTITDTAITGNVRCGIEADSASCRHDNFEAADLVVAGGQPIVKRFGGVQFAHRIGGAQGRPAIQAW